MKRYHSILHSAFCNHRSARGFTLAEVLLAVLLITAVLLPLSAVYAAGMSLWKGLQQREVAARTLHNTAAVIQTIPFSRLFPGHHRLPGPDLPKGQTTVVIDWLPDLQLVRAAVRVSWQSSTGPQHLERQVLRSPFGPYPPEGERGEETEEAP